MITNIIIDNKPYSCIMCWSDPISNVNRISGTYPIPKERNSWSGKKFFLEKLTILENFLLKNKQTHHNNLQENCQLCSKKYISKTVFMYKNIIWNDSLYHYVNQHNMKPPSKFIRFVLDNDPTNDRKCKNSTVVIKGKIKKVNKFTYVKIKANQLMIIDALMEHGGVKPKYVEKHEVGYKYSEHAGMLEFNVSSLERVIISGTTQRTNNDDPEIFFPSLGESAYNYEYIFHTHPSTPSPGGRINEGILYEFPSTNDIYHFIDHFNYGKVQGSLVVTPEGLYNIRKYNFDKKHINVDVSLGPKLRTLYKKIQKNAIDKFRKQFDSEYFYSVIAQDTVAIDTCNKLLLTYDLYIDYFPRQKTKISNWIIGTIYLPICR